MGSDGSVAKEKPASHNNDVDVFENVDDVRTILASPGQNIHNPQVTTEEALLAETSGLHTLENVDFVVDTEEVAVQPISEVEAREEVTQSIVDHETVASNSNEVPNDQNLNTPVKFTRSKGPVVYGTPARFSPPKTYFGMVPGNLRGSFLGNLSGSSLVFQLVGIQHASQLNCYRVTLSDGKDMSNNILFYQNLNSRVKAFIQAVENATFPFVNILEFDILGNTHLAIADFKFVKTFPSIVGSPNQIEETFFSNLAKGLKNLPNKNKMRGMLARNVPSSKRKVMPEFTSSDTPVKKRTRTNRKLL